MIERIKEIFAEYFQRQCTKIQVLSANGSNRKYFRIFDDEKTYIAVYHEDKKENQAFVDYAQQLKSKQIKVPQIYCFYPEDGIYLQEDLGDTTLYSFISNATREQRREIYLKVVKDLVKIQLVENFDYAHAYPREAFDKQSIQWDLNYFKYYFLKLAYVKFDEQALEEDFQRLTDYLLSADSSYFMFRDFQSRNIMIKDDELFYIDFQGGRKGSLCYDLASLLYDAKAELSRELRLELLDAYLTELEKYRPVDRKNFEQHFYAFVYVRIMQAMGAYGYRGFFEGKSHFLKSIPFALRNLQYLQDNVCLPIEMNTLNDVFSQLINSQRLKAIMKKNKLNVNIKSFSYRKGYPHDLSEHGGGFIFDCRGLTNPGRFDEYKVLTGKNQEVIDFFKDKEDVIQFLDHATAMVTQSIENYLQRGFSHLSVYFGCTGGRHRSVFCAEELGKRLSQNPDINVFIQHVEQNL